MKSIFNGTGVAIVTPFYKNKIDYTSLKNLIEKTINEGANAIILLGTTGESCTISFTERKNLIKFCKNTINNRIKLIVGVGNNNLKTCFKNMELAKKFNVDAVLAVTPYYNKTTQHGIIEYYKQLAKFELPIIMYNVPARTGLNIELSTIQHIISTNPYVYGIKESTTDINRILELLNICKDKISVYSGEDHLNYVFYTLGSQGTISVTANAYTKQVSLIHKLIEQKEYTKALNLQNQLQPINHILFCETNPVPIKNLLQKLNLIKSNEVRLPLVPLTEEHNKELENIMKDFNSNLFH